MNLCFTLKTFSVKARNLSEISSLIWNLDLLAGFYMILIFTLVSNGHNSINNNILYDCKYKMEILEFR